MTILVTGATGNVGSHLVRHLLDLGEAVRCLTRDPAKASFPEGAEAVEGDLSDPSTLPPALEGVTRAHLITFAGDDYTPIPNGESLVTQFTKAGVSRVTMLKGDVDATPIETAVAESSLEWTTLAPVEFMANMLEWVDGVQKGRVEEGFVDVPSTVVHESDIASVAAHVLVGGGYAGETLWITGPQALTVRERVEIIQEVTGKHVDLVALSPEEVQAQWRSYGFSDDDIAYMTQMKTEPPMAARVPQDTVRTVTGREPLTFREWATENRTAFGSG